MDYEEWSILRLIAHHLCCYTMCHHNFEAVLDRIRVEYEDILDEIHEAHGPTFGHSADDSDFEDEC